VRFCTRVVGSTTAASPPELAFAEVASEVFGSARSGFAARCAAGLCPAASFNYLNLGYALGLGSALIFQAKGQTGGAAPNPFFTARRGRATPHIRRQSRSCDVKLFSCKATLGAVFLSFQLIYFTRMNGMSRIREVPTCRLLTFPFLSRVNQTT